MHERIRSEIQWHTEGDMSLATRVAEQLHEFQRLRDAVSITATTGFLAARVDEALQRAAECTAKTLEASRRMERVLRASDVLEQIDKTVAWMTRTQESLNLSHLAIHSKPLVVELGRRDLAGTLDKLLDRAFEHEAGVRAINAVLQEIPVDHPGNVSEPEATHAEIEAAVEVVAEVEAEVSEPENDETPEGASRRVATDAARRVGRFLLPRSLPAVLRDYAYVELVRFVVEASVATMAGQGAELKAVERLLDTSTPEAVEPPAQPPPDEAETPEDPPADDQWV